MKMVLVASFAALLAGTAGAVASCVVADPTGTPLNIRSGPSGRVVGQIENGIAVMITDRATDSKGSAWVHVVQDGTREEIGWVFARYLRCN